ncbi:MAG: hypothetical protein V4568_04725 [Pseudomonadota bacterium]
MLSEWREQAQGHHEAGAAISLEQLISRLAEKSVHDAIEDIVKFCVLDSSLTPHQFTELVDEFEKINKPPLEGSKRSEKLMQFVKGKFKNRWQPGVVVKQEAETAKPVARQKAVATPSTDTQKSSKKGKRGKGVG